MGRCAKPGVSKNSNAIGGFKKHDLPSIIFRCASLERETAICHEPDRFRSVYGNNKCHEVRLNFTAVVVRPSLAKI